MIDHRNKFQFVVQLGSDETYKELDFIFNRS